MTPEQQIDAIILGVLTQAGVDAADDIQNELNTAYPPSSKPGESPHRRTGFLRGQVVSAVEQSGSITILNIVSLAPYSRFLEDGTTRMRGARPFMGPAQDKWAPIIHQRLTEAFSTSAPALVH